MELLDDIQSEVIQVIRTSTIECERTQDEGFINHNIVRFFDFKGNLLATDDSRRNAVLDEYHKELELARAKIGELQGKYDRLVKEVVDKKASEIDANSV